jgi:hypothetical protein
MGSEGMERSMLPYIGDTTFEQLVRSISTTAKLDLER